MSPKASRPADSPGDEGPPPGYIPIAKPKYRPVSWWWKSAGLIALLAAAVTAIVYIVKDPDPQDSARGTSEQVARSLTNADMPAFKSYICDVDKLDIPASWMRMGTTYVVAVSEEHDGVATATLATGQREDVDLAVLLQDKDGDWCVTVMTLCPRYSRPAFDSSIPDVTGCRDRPGRR